MEAPKHTAGASRHSISVPSFRRWTVLCHCRHFRDSHLLANGKKTIQGGLLMAAPVLKAPKHVQLQSTAGLRPKQSAASQKTGTYFTLTSTGHAQANVEGDPTRDAHTSVGRREAERGRNGQDGPSKTLSSGGNSFPIGILH